MMALYTFGYEGLSIEDFIACLQRAGVQTVVDVRQLPLSRKKGFSKTAFGFALQRAGVVYTHLPALGCPKPIREGYKIDRNWARYTQSFNAYLGSQSGAIMELAHLSRKTSACLVCFEADFNFCHRSLVARAAAHAGGQRVVHLTAKAEIVDLAARIAA